MKNKRSESPGRARGFTLVEALIATSVAALLIMVLFTVFSGGLRSFGRGEKSTEATLAALVAAERIQSELEQAFTTRDEAERPVTVDADGRRLVFARADPTSLDAEKGHAVRAELAAVRVAGGYELRVDGQSVSRVRLHDVQFEFIPADDPESGGVHLVRALVVGRDAGGGARVPLVVLKALELPTQVLREKRARESRGRPR